MIKSIVLHGAETGSLSKETIRKMEAIEMRISRKIERIIWTKKNNKNKEVLRRVEKSWTMMH